MRLVHEPGTRWRYSGGGYTVAQLLVEEVTGEDFATFMERAVLGPLGLESSAYRWTAELERRAAQPYGRRGEPIAGQRFTAVAAAGLQTTPADLARFASACLSRFPPPGEGDEPILAPATLERMQTPAEAAPKWGLGLNVEHWGGHRVVGHTGANHGWIGSLWVVPETGDGLVLLANGTNADRFFDQLESAWVRFLERDG